MRVPTTTYLFLTLLVLLAVSACGKIEKKECYYNGQKTSCKEKESTQTPIQGETLTAEVTVRAKIDTDNRTVEILENKTARASKGENKCEFEVSPAPATSYEVIGGSTLQIQTEQGLESFERVEDVDDSESILGKWASSKSENGIEFVNTLVIKNTTSITFIFQCKF